MRSLVFVCLLFTGACDRAPTVVDTRATVPITFRSEPAGATIVVDGIARGPAPLTLPLTKGPHRMRALSSGSFPAPDQKFQVGDGEPIEHTLTLVKSH